MTGAGEVSLSICIVSWNTRDLLEACLRSLYADPDSAGWQVLVVDNASSDGSADMVADRFPRAELIRSPRNLGFSRGNNLALARATGRCLLLLNSDTAVDPGALGRLVDYLDSDPDAGAVGPRLVYPDGSLQLSCGRPPGLHSEIVHKLLLHRIFPFFRLGRWHHGERRCVGWVTGACLMVRREAAAETGFLDPNIFMCFEDLDWCMRLRKKGWSVVYLPSSRVVHHDGQSIRKNLCEMLVVSQQSLFYLFEKHFGKGRLHALRLLTVIEMLLRSALWILPFLLPSGRRNEGGLRLRAYWRILRRTVTDRSYWAPMPRGAPESTERTVR